MEASTTEEIKTPQGLEGLPLFDNLYKGTAEETKNAVGELMIEVPVNLKHPLYFHGWEYFGKKGNLKRVLLSYEGKTISIVFGDKDGTLFFPSYLSESEENKDLLYRIFDDTRVASYLFLDTNKRKLHKKDQKNNSERRIEVELDGCKYIIKESREQKGAFIFFIQISGSILKVKSYPYREKSIDFISEKGKIGRKWVSDSDYLMLNRIIKLVAVEPEKYGLEKLKIFQH